MEKRLYRDELNKKLAGVCAGLAEYLNVDVTIVRVIFVVALVMKGVGFLPYIILWIVLPKKPYNLNNPHVDYTVPPQPNPFNPFTPGAAPQPPFAKPPKQRSNAGLIVGICMVVFGSLFLINEFNIIPIISFHQIWPIMFIIIGAGIIFSGKTKEPKPFEKEKWDGAVKEEPAPSSAENAANNTNAE